MLPVIDIEDAVAALGNAAVYTGNALVEGGMELLGAKEGAASAEVTYQFSDLTAPEHTGDVVHESTVLGQQITVTVPIIIATGEQYAKINPLGNGTGGGFKKPRKVVPTTVMLVPEIDMDEDGLSFDGFVWSPAEPVHMITIWRARVSHGPLSYSHENGGKVVCEVTFTGMFDTRCADGHCLYTIGDPTQSGLAVIL